MKLSIKSSQNYQNNNECLVLALKPAKNLGTQVAELNKLTGGLIKRVQDQALFEAKAGKRC